MLFLLIMACGQLTSESSAPLDLELHLGRFKLDREVRGAIAFAPGSIIPATQVTAAASECDATIGDRHVGTTWESAPDELSGVVSSSCGAPVWLELPPTPAEGTDGLLIILDTLRYDHVGELTPNIAAHAARGWHGANGWSPSPWTIPSVSALFTGRPPWAITSPGDHRLPQQQTTLAELSPNHQTWMITTNAYVSSANGFDQGFSRFAYADNDPSALSLARQWLSEPSVGPRLLVVQLMSAHLPYQPSHPPAGGTDRVGDAFWDLDGWRSYQSEENRDRIRALYRGSVQDLDSYVGELLEMVDETWVTALISDHGEELWDHGGFEHGHAFWEEITRIHGSIVVPESPPTEDTSPYQTQDFGQRFALALGVASQDSWATSTDDAADVITFSHPLDTRDEVLHRWGVRTEEGELLSGGTQMSLEGPSTQLHQRLFQLTQAANYGGPSSNTTCRIVISEGETVTVPSSATWGDQSPPSSWGEVKRGRDGSVSITPVRSGEWLVQDGGGDECEITTESEVVNFSEFEESALRALGYLR